MIEHPFFCGTVYYGWLRCWRVSWESSGDYRFWCFLRNPCKAAVDSVAVVCLNPGSLSHAGKRLARDTTLRALTNAFAPSSFHCLVLNLFDLSTTRPADLFTRWNERDSKCATLIFTRLRMFSVAAYMMAYGDDHLSASGLISSEVSRRIRAVEAKLSYLRPLPVLRNHSGNPKHPRRWQIEKLLPRCSSYLRSASSYSSRSLRPNHYEGSEVR